MNQTAQAQLEMRQTEEGSVVIQTSEISRLFGLSRAKTLFAKYIASRYISLPAAITHGSEYKSPEWTGKKKRILGGKRLLQETCGCLGVKRQ